MTQPTIILVHGALSGGSIWSGVTTRLQASGLEVFVPAMPLRSLDGDVEYLKALLGTIEGPVVLAGHSYGGSIISHPDFSTDEVKGLVFVSAFAPDTGETTGELNGRWPGSKLGEATTVTRPYPGGTDLYLKTGSFAEVYAGDLPPATIAQMAATQRPIDVAALNGGLHGKPAWRDRPSFFLISTADTSLVPEAQYAMAERASGTVVEAHTSHASPASDPEAVARLIMRAAGMEQGTQR